MNEKKYNLDLKYIKGLTKVSEHDIGILCIRVFYNQATILPGISKKE